MADRLEPRTATGSGDDERVRLPMRVQLGLRQPAAGGTPQKPLKLDTPRATLVNDTVLSLIDPLLAYRQFRELAGGDRGRSADPGQLLDTASHMIHAAHEHGHHSRTGDTGERDREIPLGDV